MRREVPEGVSYEVTVPHFQEELIEDDLTLADAETAILRGRINRTYSADPRGTRYRIVGPATDGRPVAVVVRIKPTGIPLLITVYVEAAEGA